VLNLFDFSGFFNFFLQLIKEEETYYQEDMYRSHKYGAMDKKQVFGKRRVCLCVGACQTVALCLGIDFVDMYFCNRQSSSCLLTVCGYTNAARFISVCNCKLQMFG